MWLAVVDGLRMRWREEGEAVEEEKKSINYKNETMGARDGIEKGLHWEKL